MILLVGLLQQKAVFQAGAPSGTGLEWLTVGAIVLPAVVLVVILYFGAQKTV